METDHQKRTEGYLKQIDDILDKWQKTSTNLKNSEKFQMNDFIRKILQFFVSLSVRTP